MKNRKLSLNSKKAKFISITNPTHIHIRFKIPYTIQKKEASISLW